jgi:hypothetical protein
VAKSLGDEALIPDCFAALTGLLELALSRNVAGSSALWFNLAFKTTDQI